MGIVKTLRQSTLPFIDLSSRQTFIANMMFMHGLMVASEDLIDVALSTNRCELPLIEYFTTHREEERDHAQWLRDDLESVGITIPRVHWQAASIAGTQYYLIKHVSPHALIGYMAALEHKPMPLVTVAELEKRYGKSLLRTVRYHSEHDIDHTRDLLAFVRSASFLDMPLITETTTKTLEAITSVASTWRRASNA